MKLSSNEGCRHVTTLREFLVFLHPGGFHFSKMKMKEQAIKKEFKPIVAKDMFMDKNPRLARLIPGFVYRFISKTMALDFINEVLKDHGHERGFEFANSVIKKFNVTVDVVGKENLPEGGPFNIVSNHPLGGFDGGVILKEIGEHYDEKYRVLVNDLLMNIHQMDGYFIPINKHGTQAMENVRRIDELYSSENNIMTFPAGLVSRRKRGIIEDPPWQKHFIAKSKSHKRDLITVNMSGHCSNLFYNVSNIRKFFGMKTNIEMFLLPRETFKHVNHHFTLTIGKPISYQTFDKRYKPIEWAEKVRQYCYDLAKDPTSTFSVD